MLLKCGTYTNKMKTYQIIGQITFRVEVMKEDGSSYYRVDIHPIAYIVNGVISKELPFTTAKAPNVLNVSKNDISSAKYTKGAFVLADCEEHIEGETSYVKDGVEVFHTSTKIHANFVSGLPDMIVIDLFENELISEFKYKHIMYNK